MYIESTSTLNSSRSAFQKGLEEWKEEQEREMWLDIIGGVASMLYGFVADTAVWCNDIRAIGTVAQNGKTVTMMSKMDRIARIFYELNYVADGLNKVWIGVESILKGDPTAYNPEDLTALALQNMTDMSVALVDLQNFKETAQDNLLYWQMQGVAGANDYLENLQEVANDGTAYVQAMMAATQAGQQAAIDAVDYNAAKVIRKHINSCVMTWRR